MARPTPLPTILLLGSFLFAAAGCAGSPRAHDLIGSWTRLAVEGGGPGPRLSPLSWTDSTGTLWMFAGEGPEGFLTDMWRFDGNKWAPVKGAPSSSVPAGRVRGVTWTDSRDRLWLYGGFGRDGTGCLGTLGDLWVFSEGRFSRAGTSSPTNSDPSYGPAGQHLPGSCPGGRSRSAWWKDGEGRVWLYGGANRGDMWRFDGALWAWVGGSTEGDVGWSCGEAVGKTPDFPGARNAPASWTDAEGNLLLFGGEGWDDQCQATIRADLWSYSPRTGAWTRREEDQKAEASAATGRPGPRWYAAVAPDGRGGAWIFGGDSSAGWEEGPPRMLGDLWKASGTGWVRGTAPGGAGPSPRRGALTWTGPDGSFYLFGGEGPPGPEGRPGFLDDLWVFREGGP